MNLKRINPNHFATQLDADTLYKLLALCLWKYEHGQSGSFKITMDDLKKSENAGLVMATHFHADSIEFYLVTEEEAKKLAAEQGGAAH